MIRLLVVLLSLCALLAHAGPNIPRFANSTVSSSSLGPTATKPLTTSTPHHHHKGNGTEHHHHKGNGTGLAGVTGINHNVTTFAHLWGWTGCSTGQKEAVLDGLEEAHTILGTEGVWYGTIFDHFNDYSAVEYLGDPRAYYTKRQDIQQNFERAYDYRQHWYHWWDTQVFCLPDDVGYCQDEPGYIAVENKYDKNGLALAFCQRYFSLGKLKDVYNEASTDDSLIWDLSNYENRARPWITTMMRINSIGSFLGRPLTPQKVKYPGEPLRKSVSSCAQSKYLAKNAEYFDDTAVVKTLLNPDNWSWFALAQYVTNKLGNYPSLPQTPDDVEVPS